MGQSASLVILVPVFNDWLCADALGARIAQLGQKLGRPDIIFIDDGSTDVCDLGAGEWLSEFDSVSILRAGANLGHQRAIAIGLAHVAAQSAQADVIIIDADGEDDPSGIPTLVDALRGDMGDGARAVVAQRASRSEPVAFRTWYRTYKWAFRVLTGRRLDFGNFSALNDAAVRRLVHSPDLWNHFPAALMRSRIPVLKVPLARSDRLHGTSHMNFVSLVNHGLSAIAAFSDVVFARLLIAVGGLMALLVALGATIAGVRLFGSSAIPGWATVATGFTLVALFQFMTLLAVMTFIQLSSRSNIPTTPLRAAPWYTESIEGLRNGE